MVATTRMMQLVDLRARGVTLYALWAWAICRLDKRIENRTWHPYGPAGWDPARPQVLLIHAGKNLGASPGFPAAMGELRNVAQMARYAGWEVGVGESGATFTRGDVRRVVLGHASPSGRAQVHQDLLPGFTGLAGGHYDFEGAVTSAIVAVAELTAAGPMQQADLRRWGVPGCVGWQLGRVVPLSRPIPHKGAQGLWTPSPEAIAQLDADGSLTPRERDALDALLASVIGRR